MNVEKVHTKIILTYHAVGYYHIISLAYGSGSHKSPQMNMYKIPSVYQPLNILVILLGPDGII